MSIAEFLDGMPTYDVRNFSRFKPHNSRTKCMPIYISTAETTDEQLIVNDEPDLVLRHLCNKWDKRRAHETDELLGSFAKIRSKYRT